MIYLTDSGLETDLIFKHGLELPAFAAFPLLHDRAGRTLLADYYREHAVIAAEHGFGFEFEAPTWRANTDWGQVVGYDQPALDRVNEQSIAFLSELAAEVDYGPTIISGCIGPRSDGYHPTAHMTADEARAYHAPQIAAFARAGADLVNAMTITYPAEAVGIVAAAVATRVPVTISFTLGLNGRLPDGTALGDAIRAVDTATDTAAAYFAINCVHPDYIIPVLESAEGWTSRLQGLRANASRRSHEELDEATDLDDGDPTELAAGYVRLRELVPSLTMLGGCCGTDARHVRAIAEVL